MHRDPPNQQRLATCATVPSFHATSMADPYRDELFELRVENERLRRRLKQRRRSVLLLPAAAVLTFVAREALRPLLNADSDAKFLLGVAGVALVIAIDAICVVAVLRPHDGAM
jgi:hypothetical protein